MEKKYLACGKLNHFRAVCKNQARSKVHNIAVGNAETDSIASSEDLNFDTDISIVLANLLMFL